MATMNFIPATEILAEFTAPIEMRVGDKVVFGISGSKTVLYIEREGKIIWSLPEDDYWKLVGENSLHKYELVNTEKYYDRGE